jgi:hypothetical protein
MFIEAHTWTTARIDNRYWSGSIPTTCNLSENEFKGGQWRPLLRQAILNDTNRITDNIYQRRIQSAVIYFDDGKFKELDADSMVIDPRAMIPYDHTLINHYVMSRQEVDRYNATQARINTFIADGLPIPEYELHDSWAQIAIHINQ